MRMTHLLLGVLFGIAIGGCAGADDEDDDEDLDAVSAQLTVCNGNCVYVRAGARGNGSSWSNALGRLPDGLQRGKTYFLAAGAYPGRTFADAAQGSTPITIKKATASDHGTNTGWSASFGSGKATFGSLRFQRPNYVLDGGDGRGLVVRGEFESVAIDVREGADNLTLRRLEVDGDFAKNARNRHVRGACGAIHARGVKGLLVEWSDIHDAADDGIQLATVSDVTVRDNTIHHLGACGTDGENCVGTCNNGHSDALEFSNVKRGTFSRNFMHHVHGTSAMFFANQTRPASLFVEDLTIVNNIFYTPDAGAVAYIQQARDIRVVNNVFWGRRKGAYGGLMLGRSVSDLDVYNNIITSINGNHMKFQYNSAQHRFDYNLLAVDVGQVRKGSHDKVGLPRFVGIPDDPTAGILDAVKLGDFALRAGSPAINAGWRGNASTPVPTTDIKRAPRKGAPDIGVFEF